MPSQEPQNTQEENANAQKGGGQRREPSIRTMKSDVAEFMKKTKPSLIQLLTNQAEYQPPAIEKKRGLLPLLRITAIALTALVIAGIGWFGFRYFTAAPSPVTPPSAETTAPPSPISAEKMRVITIGNNALQLQQALFTTAETQERSGSVTRIVLRLNENGNIRFLTFGDFLNILHIAAPPQILNSLRGDFFIYIYYANDGPHAVLLAPSKDTGQTFAGMLAWENSIQRDLEILFLGSPPPQIIAPFIDETYQNIDYRFLAIQPPSGIGHFIFPAKNMLVITTSEEAVHIVINRLFASH